MKILILILFLLSTFAFAPAYAGIPEMQIVKFQSKNYLRSSFDAYLYPVKNSKGLIVYIYGGGCRWLVGEPIHLIETFPLNLKLIALGYSVVIANYTQGINPTWLSSTGVDTAYPNLNEEDRCKIATEYHLQGIRDMMAQISKIQSSGPVVMMGHSYGGYLVNYLASDSVRLTNATAFVSYAGIWNPALRDQQSAKFHVSKNLSVISHDPKNLSPILLIHSKDDDSVNINQLDGFKEWLGDLKRENQQILELRTGGHSTSDPKINTQIANTIDRFLNFLAR